MISSIIARRAAPLVRQFGTSAVRRAHDTSGIIGSSIPFGIKNRYLLTLGFIIYFGSGLALPFFVLRRAMLRQS